MASGARPELGKIFRSILNSENVYFQPPESLKLDYPCIIYQLADIETRHANNKPYSHDKQYQVILITKDPDNIFKDILSDLPLCTFERFYTSQNLNHYVYRLYF